jgi:FkbM family methyltransferase
VYSQYEEERYILEALLSPNVIGTCRFLDIGAFHPTDKSNTRALVELGWTGVMVEPSPGPLKNLLQEYGHNEKITLIAAAVGLNNDLLHMHVTDDATSTTDEKNYEIWKNASPFLGKMWVPTITLKQIFHQFGGFDFINFDAEGTSVELFRDLVQNTPARPRCVCIEHDSRYVEIAQLAEPSGYRQIHLNGTNVVLVYK